MIRIALAAFAAFALSVAAPAFAGGCADCNDCPHKHAAADKAAKPDEKPAVACPCVGEGKECKCGATCQCPHCAAKKAEKKEEPKKT